MNITKISLSLLLFLLSLTLTGGFSSVMAAHVAGLTCSNLDASVATGNAPHPLLIVCPFLRVFNGALLVSGVVFIIMLVYGGVKLSMSFGDPKGLQGATTTWTYTLIGFAVVVGVFVIFNIVLNILGITVLSPNAIFADITTRLGDLLGPSGLGAYK